MLQISTGKFFKGDAYETLRRAIYYTNYRIFREDELIKTQAGSLQSVIGIHGLGALTCEIIERIEKMPGGPYSGEIIATGSNTLINDFAAIVSFALNVTCTADLELARRLVADDRPSLGADLVPQKYVPRMFDRAVDWQQGDVEDLQRFVSELMALERKSYEGAMRAIRRYVIGAHRISDDVNLAYALFVMSIESLAQKFDGFEPAWDDYDQNRRQRIDEALGGTPEIAANKVRAAVSKFYRWAKITNRFIPALNFSRRHGKSARDHDAEQFDVLTIEQARAAYDRICQHSDPQGRFLAFMALLYSQTIIASSSLRRSDLARSEESDCWIVKRDDDEGFELEPEVSSTLDECLALADKHSRVLGQHKEEYVLPGRSKYYISPAVASQRIREASGHKGGVLRRTGVVNMFRGGQKTMGTVVLRDQLKVSIPVIQRAIKLAGHSVNAELDRDAAEEFRRAFLEQDDE